MVCVQALGGAGLVLEGGGPRRVESQEVRHGCGSGGIGLEGLGRSEGGGDRVKNWGHFLFDAQALGPTRLVARSQARRTQGPWGDAWCA